VYSLSGLSPGNHVLSIVATGTHSARSGGSWIWVDGFQVSGTTPDPPSIGPSINPGGILSGASYSPLVSPGQIVSIFGKEFAAGSTSITACGRAVPLFDIFPGQINAQLPTECASGIGTATVTVGDKSATQTFAVAPAAPGIFTSNGSGVGDGVI